MYINSLSEIAGRLRTRLGESRATVEQHSTPLADATTPSLEALKAYSSGIKAVLVSADGGGRAFFRRAVEIDPKFAMAHAMSGAVVQQSWRVGTVSPEHDQRLATA